MINLRNCLHKASFITQLTPPLFVILSRTLDLLEIRELLTHRIEFTFMILSHHPDLHTLLQTAPQQSNHVLASDAIEVSLETLPVLSVEEESLMVDFPTDKVEIFLKTVVRLQNLGPH